MSRKSPSINIFLNAVKETFGEEKKSLTRKEISLIRSKGIGIPGIIWKYEIKDSYPALFDISSLGQKEEVASESTPLVEKIKEVVETVTPKTEILEPMTFSMARIADSDEFSKYIPQSSSLFVPSGDNFKIIKNIVAKNKFFPLYIWGVSGLGKTFQIEQACAMYNKPLFRCQITRETSNEDLIGGFALVNGNTIWIDGPVLKAYKSGGVLLLDEIDLNPNLMILQVVLENKPILIQQTGEMVHPKEGFTVFATGNTKGDGSDSRYVGTSVLNDAFLERFVTILEQKIPTIKTEEKMIDKYCNENALQLSDEIKESFLKWIELVRKNYTDENTEIYISSRRVQYILKMYELCGNFNKSIEFSLARYPEEEASAFIKTWNAIFENKEAFQDTEESD